MQEEHRVPWKPYIKIFSEAILGFSLATFCLAMFFTHQGHHFVFLSVFMVALYLFISIICTKKMVEKLNLAAFMLFIPLAPLIPLVIILMLIPLMQQLQ